jgi:uncharacterized DUF497 family protein
VIKDDLMQRLIACEGFEWDAGNTEKIWERHQVSLGECEELFLNRPLIVETDLAHSSSEERLYALGQSDGGRLMFLAFTIRRRLIRVISARGMSRQERRIYRSAI